MKLINKEGESTRRKPYKRLSRNWDTFTLIRNRRSKSFSTPTPFSLKIAVSQVGLLRLTGGEEANEPGRGPHQERQRAGTRAREPSSTSVGKARFCHRCRRLATERRVVFSGGSRGQGGHAERDP